MSQDESQITPLTTETTKNSGSVITSTVNENSCPDFAPIDSTSHVLNGVQQPEVHQKLSFDNIQQPNCEVYQENVGQIISAGGESSGPWPEEQSTPWPEQSSDPRAEASIPWWAGPLPVLADADLAFLSPGNVIQPQENSLAGIHDLQLQVDQPQQSIANAQLFQNVEFPHNEIAINAILSTPNRQQQTTLLNTTRTYHAGSQTSIQQQIQDLYYTNEGRVLTAPNPAVYTRNQNYPITECNTRDIALADAAITSPSSISHLSASQGNQSVRNDGSKKEQYKCNFVGCHRLYDSLYQFTEHLHLYPHHYPHDKPHVCQGQFCGIRFPGINDYRDHRSTHCGEAGHISFCGRYTPDATKINMR